MYFLQPDWDHKTAGLNLTVSSTTAEIHFSYYQKLLLMKDWYSVNSFIGPTNDLFKTLFLLLHKWPRIDATKTSPVQGFTKRYASNYGGMLRWILPNSNPEVTSPVL